jgi:hypothetical protein
MQMIARPGLKLAPREWTLTLVLGLAAGVFLSVSLLFPTKWFFFLLFSLVGAAFLVMVPERQKVLLYLTVVLLTVPLDFHPIYLESNTTPWPVAGWRISLFDVTFLFLLVCWLLRRVLDNTWRIRLFPRLTLAYGLLWGLCLLSLARADLPLVIKLCALFLVTESWFIFLYFANQLLNPRLLWGVVAALLAAGAFQALLGLLQYFSGGTLGLEFFGEAKTHMMMRAGDVLVSRVSGTFGHPNNLAGYLAMVLQLNLALLFAPLKRGLRVLLGACLGLLGVALLLTLSRGGWLAGTLGVMITAFLCLRRRTRRPALAWFVTLLVSGGDHHQHHRAGGTPEAPAV